VTRSEVTRSEVNNAPFVIPKLAALPVARIGGFGKKSGMA